MSKQKINEIDQAIKTLNEQKQETIRADEKRKRDQAAKAAKQSRAAIDKLAAEYNEIEIQQSERLKKLFRLIKQRKGYKHVSFSSGDNWSNCWDRPDHLDKGILKPFERLITEIKPGE